MDARMAREPEHQQKLSYYKALHDIGNQIHAAKDINEILINLREKILSLFDADRITIYVVDGKRKEVYSRFAAGAIQEIRVPINNKSIAGYTANNAQITNMVNAYDTRELKLIDRELGFDRSWDEKSKYMTKQMLTVPIFYKKYVIGVLQLINKKGGDRFSVEDQTSAVEMAKVLGIAFFNQKKMAKASSMAGLPPGCHWTISRNASHAKASAAKPYDQTLGIASQLLLNSNPVGRSESGI